MAEHEAADRDESREEHDEQEQHDAALRDPLAKSPEAPEQKPEPLDEDAAWAAIIAGYGEQPADPPGAKPFKSVEDLAGLVAEAEEAERGPAKTGSDKPVAGSIVFAPGVGPRDYDVAEASEDDLDESDEGHFVPPEPPPLPEADTTAKFAWLAVVGGPLLMLLAVLLGWPMTWWLTTLGIGGFLGGFATLVMRMGDGDENDEDPGRGAVV
ncbi:hypothetical protein H9Y04_06735 [Streptomyces sp. TRM66268-LWL]|uniref:DUF308 domain-containing protein n=1 Tax=Streptomyces polyasparticus TaxID=2767826 RepID=A0ABR7SD50_9ACTN|nr:hypothetical protein [Streptomyces polyasparticus]MBC9712268.1 hypothetical protein [Streptomyces polyasparticus]